MNCDMFTDIENNYGIICKEITPINGGWLNKLWKVITDDGDLLIKQYSSKRYNKNKLQLIEYALQRQIIIKKDGILCPHIYQQEGHVIQFLNDTTAYIVMDFCGGRNENSSTITTTKMQSLGKECAKLHAAFSKLPTDGVVKEGSVEGKQILAGLWENYKTCKEQISLNDSIKYKNTLLAQEAILKQLTEDFFGKLPKGITHEDFTPDNILFDENGVSAIIDFDRNKYSFIWHDIGRAILSFALEDNQLNLDKIHAFVKGYSQCLPLTIANVADALRITWCIEVLWWIKPACFTMDASKATRYRDEIVWLTEKWFEIDSLLCLN